MENGEYLRSAEITEEQNYNIIDGRNNKRISARSPEKKESVIKRLREKQAEVAARSKSKTKEKAAENTASGF